MLINESSLQHWIDNFYGYGSWRSKFWFISYEESGGNLPEEVADKINYFQKNHSALGEYSLCDIRDLYRHVGVMLDGPKVGLFNNRFEYRFSDNAIQNNIWKNLIAFEYGYLNKKLPDLFEHQKNSFLSSENNEALIPLYPLPSPHNHAWYYSWLHLPHLNFLKSRTLYEDHVYKQRIKTILTNVNVFKPEVVLMYGMNNINALKKSVQEFFPSVNFKMVKAIKQETPQHHRADIDGTILLITTQIPALRHNRVETGFDWEKLGRNVRNQALGTRQKA
jgi:hypothetical protein